MMGMGMAHPMHMHGRQFRVLSRSGADTNALRSGIHDQGWTDTVVVLPGETVRVQVTFSDYAGLFLYHCHILEHEDMGMMRTSAFDRAPSHRSIAPDSSPFASTPSTGRRALSRGIAVNAARWTHHQRSLASIRLDGACSNASPVC
ncbi:MAG: multicopper oxidase domain-containing protein [Vicinamibacterales bacterium]